MLNIVALAGITETKLRSTLKGQIKQKRLNVTSKFYIAQKHSECKDTSINHSKFRAQRRPLDIMHWPILFCQYTIGSETRN